MQSNAIQLPSALSLPRPFQLVVLRKFAQNRTQFSNVRQPSYIKNKRGLRLRNVLATMSTEYKHKKFGPVPPPEGTPATPPPHSTTTSDLSPEQPQFQTNQRPTNPPQISFSFGNADSSNLHQNLYVRNPNSITSDTIIRPQPRRAQPQKSFPDPTTTAPVQPIIFYREILLEPPAPSLSLYQSQDRIPNHSFITPKIFPSTNEYHRRPPTSVLEFPVAAGGRQLVTAAGAARLGLNSPGGRRSSSAVVPGLPIVDIQQQHKIYPTNGNAVAAAPNKYPTTAYSLNPDVSLQRVPTNNTNFSISPASATSSATSSGTSSPPSVISSRSQIENDHYVHLQAGISSPNRLNTIADTSGIVANPTSTTTVLGRKKARKAKDEDLIPDCVKGEMTRRDIVESNIEEFNSKCASKPEEQKSILKDKRRKGKNRVAAKKSRERKISKLKELKIQRDRLMKEDRELENLLQEYATRKRFLEQKYKSLQGKVERARLRQSSRSGFMKPTQGVLVKISSRPMM